MGIGAGTPSVMRLVEHQLDWRSEYRWDGERLSEACQFLRGKLHRRYAYVWRADELNDIQTFDPKLADYLGDRPYSHSIFTWENGRPIAVDHVSGDDGELITRETWDWQGQDLVITEALAGGPAVGPKHTLDERGRIISCQRDQWIDEVIWSVEGRLLEARTRGLQGQGELAVTFDWDGPRLLQQRYSDNRGIYRFEYD